MNYRCIILFALLAAGCSDSSITDQDEACSPWPTGYMLGTSLSDELLDVLVDDRGRVYLAGYQNGSTGSANIDPGGAARGILLKYDRLGNLQSTLSLDTSGASSIEALALNNQTSELFLVGRSNGALPGYTNNGQFDLLAGWLHSDEWQPHLAQFGDQRPQHPRRLALGWSDELLVAGFDDIYVPSNYVAAWENPMLIKITRYGTQLRETWNQHYDTAYTDVINGLAVADATDGAIYVSGHNDAGPERGMFVKKYDSQGIELWHRQQSDIAFDNAAALHVQSDGNILLAGSTFAQLGTRSYGQLDSFIRKLDASTGETIWTAQYGSTESDWVTDMTVDARGYIYVVGETLGVIEQGQINADRNAIFLLKLDANGHMLLAKQWNSIGIDYATAVAVDACERAFIAGHTTGNLVGISNGGRDGFIFPVITR